MVEENMGRMNKTAIYPGCSLEGSSNSFMAGLEKIFRALGVEYAELDEWNCCGASSAHAMDHSLHLSLCLRNLSLAEKQGFGEILAPCAACYHRLASANLELTRNADVLGETNRKTGLDYGANVRVRNVLDFLANVVGTEKIESLVVHPLKDLKVACYYGCLNTRIPGLELFDDREDPVSMDRIVKAIGAEPIHWFHKTECCGGGLFMTMESLAGKLTSKILKDAAVRSADCVAVACPMCHNNLDTKQAEIRAEYGVNRPLPILFITQLMGLALGLDESELRIESHFVSSKSLELSKL